MIDYKEQMNDPRWVERSREIMKRDNFTCQLCGKNHVRLNVHHIRYIKGKDYWDYPDELLMTVCETCHQKIHGKYSKKKTKQKKNKKYAIFSKNKKIFYRSLIGHAPNLTANERIMYSFLVSQAVKEAIQDEYGFIDKNDLEELVYKYKERLPIQKVSYKTLSKELNISYQSAINGYNSLKEHNFIDKENRIYIGLKLFSMGYFEIPTYYPLKGEALLFYAFLKDKSSLNDGVVEAYRKNISAQFGIKEPMAKQLLAKLYKCGAVERLENGKLKIN